MIWSLLNKHSNCTCTFTLLYLHIHSNGSGADFCLSAPVELWSDVQTPSFTAKKAQTFWSKFIRLSGSVWWGNHQQQARSTTTTTKIASRLSMQDKANSNSRGLRSSEPSSGHRAVRARCVACAQRGPGACECKTMYTFTQRKRIKFCLLFCSSTTISQTYGQPKNHGFSLYEIIYRP